MMTIRQQKISMVRLLWMLGLGAALWASAAGAKPLRVLLMTGQNNHDWRATTPVLRSMLEESGRFTVEINEHPEALQPEALNSFDLLLSNWNTYGQDASIKTWPESVRLAVLGFVQKGGGFVVVHAGGSMFPEWGEFQKLIGATWGKDTHHGPVSEFPVQWADPEHPITRGLKEFSLRDELWCDMEVHGKIHVLAQAHSQAKDGSAREEPVAFVTSYGQGRGFNLVLGHDAAAMAHPGFQALLLRGAEWAATGKVEAAAPADLSGPIQAMRGYRADASRAALQTLTRLVWEASVTDGGRTAAARALASALSADATDDARKALCDLLGLVGGDEEVAALASWLKHAEVGDAACRALERIPGEASLAALRAAVPNAAPPMRAHLINALAARGDRQAVELILPFLKGPEVGLPWAQAVEVMGRIGGPAAAKHLMAIDPASRPAPDLAVLGQALFRVAEGEAAADRLQAAAPLLAAVLEGPYPPATRAAALPFYMRTEGTQGEAFAIKILNDGDPLLTRALLPALGSASFAGLRRAVVERLPEWPDGMKIQALAAVRDSPMPEAIERIIPLLASADPSVRREAALTLSAWGDASTVALLASWGAANGSKEALETVMLSLAALRGEGVEKAIETATADAAPEMKAVLLRVLTQRGAAACLPLFLKARQSESPDVRREAYKGLAQLGDELALREVLADLQKEKGEDRALIQNTAVTLLRRTGDDAPLIEAWADASPTGRAALLPLLGALRSAGGLHVLEGLLTQAEAGMRKQALNLLGGWPDASPLEALLRAAQAEDDAALRVLALRGIARLMAMDTQRSAEQKTAALKPLMEKAVSAEEKKLLLSIWSQAPAMEGLHQAVAWIEEAGVASEARAAAVRIAGALRATEPEAAEWADKLAPGTNDRPDDEALFQRLEAGGLPNLALGATVESPEGLKADGQAGGPMAAFDGKLETYWDEEDGAARYRLIVRLPKPSAVHGLRITGFKHEAFSPRNMDVLCDGHVVRSLVDLKYRENVAVVALPSLRCQTMEFIITASYGGSPAIRELEILGVSE